MARKRYSDEDVLNLLRQITQAITVAMLEASSYIFTHRGALYA